MTFETLFNQLKARHRWVSGGDLECTCGADIRDLELHRMQKVYETAKRGDWDKDLLPRKS